MAKQRDTAIIETPKGVVPVPIQGKLVQFNALLVLCSGSTVTGQGPKKHGKRKGTERKSFTTRQGCQSPPDWTENNKVQQEEWNQSFQRAELAPVPSCSDPREAAAFPPGYFFKTPSEQSLSVQFHQQPTPGGAGDPEVVPILLLCTWWFSLDKKNITAEKPLGCSRSKPGQMRTAKCRHRLRMAGGLGQ